MRPRSAAAAICLLVPCAAIASAQQPPRALGIGYGVDTSAAPVGALVQLVAQYLALPQPGFTATALWRTAEQTAGAAYDPASGFTDYRHPATVLSVQPAWPDSGTFVIKVLFARAVANGEDVRAVALARFYAVQEDARWVLTSALARHTASWSRVMVGPIEYHVPPDHVFDRARADRAAAFVDSIARALRVPPPARIPYYLAASTEAMGRALGFDWLLQASGATAGRGGWGGAQGVFSADPRVGEEYRHELAHVLAQSLRSPTGRHWFVEEGFAVWLGGHMGGTRADEAAALRAFAAKTPTASWEQLTSYDTPDAVRLATAALVVRAIFDRAGWDGVRRWLALEAGDGPLLAGLERELGVTSSTFGGWWRAEVARTGTVR